MPQKLTVPPNTDRREIKQMPPKEPLANIAPKTWWGINNSDFILETSVPYC